MTVLRYDRFSDIDSGEPNMITSGMFDEWSIGLWLGKQPKEETPPAATAAPGFNMTTILVLVAVVIVVVLVMKK